MSELLSSITGGGGAAMLMPEKTQDALTVWLKDGASARTSTTTQFYTALENDLSELLFEAATLQVISNTDEQEIFDTGTGKSGVLTQVISPRLTATGDVTIRVYVDGALKHTFIRTLLQANTSVLCIGDFANWIASNASVSQYGGDDNAGYAIHSAQGITMLSPQDTAAKGLPFGIVFEDRLQVSVQGSVNLTAGSTTHKAAAAWLTYIPEGVL